ncbi:MAG: pyruvate carboxylase subunit B [Puniceicoccaceae bacterium]
MPDDKVKTVQFNNTVLRDGHQSLAATRMRTEQMLPIVPILDSMGFGALETWGGATIDAGLRFLGEFPYDRLDAIKKLSPKTPHMMLLRGQNIVQYANFPDDVVSAFVRTSAEHGMDIFRIFDALNDPRNMRTAIRAAREVGKGAQGTICYTSSPVHTTEAFIAMGKELVDEGADSICVKDMAGLIPPGEAYAIIKGLKKAVSVPVIIHTHDTAGLGATTYYAAIEAGVDAIDCSVVPFANGTGQPDVTRMLALLDGSPRCPSFDASKLLEIRKHLEKVYESLGEFTSFLNERVDSEALVYQVPGGMLSNFRTQLKQQKMEDRFEDVFAEIPHVREKLGWIPLVTPTSQIVGVQAMLNVKFGRWKNFSPQAIDIALGYYGRTPAPVDPEIRKLAETKAGKGFITERPADLLKPRMPDLLAEIKGFGYPETEEYAVIHAMFPKELSDLMKKRSAPVASPAGVSAPAKAVEANGGAGPEVPSSGVAPTRMAVSIGGTRYEVSIEEV